jgi:hypothetical protein
MLWISMAFSDTSIAELNHHTSRCRDTNRVPHVNAVAQRVAWHGVAIAGALSITPVLKDK